MKKPRKTLYHISIFILAQIAWLMLLGIWIYWYVSNYIIFAKVGDKISPQITTDGTNALPFVGGLILLVGISTGMSLTFRHLNIQLKLHNMYDNFIANVTHELKSPLSSIQLYLETLIKRNVPLQKQLEFYELMIKDTNRLKFLINSILEISALEQKKGRYDYYVLDAGKEIEKIIKSSIVQFRLNESVLNIENDTDCTCAIDRDALKIVFDNLVDNSVKYSVEATKINIKMKRSSKRFIIEFSDNGIGIPEDAQKKIFTKFYRIYDKDVPNVKGTGLGLFWVKEIIKNHGGIISAHSEGKNKGTTFHIELPVYQASKIRYINRLLKTTREHQEKRN
jgi:two-component system, OmpR family, phosphate regulon sensor histidine kinase PhoR